MSATKTIHGVYTDEGVCLSGVKAIRANKIRIKDVFSPFPVHGLDSALGLARTRIAICAFIYGITGTSLALLMTWYMMTHDWPMDIGGKPSFMYYMNWPSFIPVTFELTVFCAAHGMALTFLLRSWILPGVSPKNPDPRTTDDKFLVQVEAKGADADKIVALMRSAGAEEVNVI